MVAGQSFGRSPEAALRDSQTGPHSPSRPRAERFRRGANAAYHRDCALNGERLRRRMTRYDLHTRQDVADGSESMATRVIDQGIHGGGAPRTWELARSLFEGIWPEFNHHGNYTGRYFGALWFLVSATHVSRYSSTTRTRGASPLEGERSLSDGTVRSKIFQRESTQWGYTRSTIRARRPHSLPLQPRWPGLSKAEA